MLIYPLRDGTPKVPATPKVIVALPAKDEAAHIGPCLAALARQTRQPDAVRLLLNNCTDETEPAARKLAHLLPFPLHIDRRWFPPAQANAGHARRVAMADAADMAGPDGVLLTTDADTLVPIDWVERNLAVLARGRDAVCGRIGINPAEAALIPAHLHADDALECELTGLLDYLAWLVDPDPYDPWPRHTEAAGASLAVTVRAFAAVGGIPAMPAGEDRAFIAALAGMDRRIRHDPEIRVITSARIHGRAPGGMADTIRRRMAQQDEFTDASLEPPNDALRRVDFRRRVRAAWHTRQLGLAFDSTLAVDLGVPPPWLERRLHSPFFGAAWAEIEAISPFLHRRRVRFADLPTHIARAREFLDVFRRAESEPQAGVG